MPDADILKVSLFGALPSGEKWSVNPVYKIGGDFSTPVTPEMLAAVALEIRDVNLPTALLATMNSACNYRGVRVEARTHAGVLVAQAEAVRSTPAVGTGSSAHPFQTSLVLSLRTPAVGGSGRGRLYWPATGIALGASTLRISSTDASSILAAFKTYLSGIKTAIDVTWDGVSLVVWSRLAQDSTTVSQLQIGDVLDVQRRRRDSLIETRSSTTFP